MEVRRTRLTSSLVTRLSDPLEWRCAQSDSARTPRLSGRQLEPGRVRRQVRDLEKVSQVTRSVRGDSVGCLALSLGRNMTGIASEYSYLRRFCRSKRMGCDVVVVSRSQL